MKKAFFLLVLLGIAPIAHAASFNCDKATSFVEKSICVDTALSKLDDAMAQSYKKAMAEAVDKDSVKSQQIEWIKKERDLCKDLHCIIDTYNKRLATLDNRAFEKKSIHDNTANDIALGRCHMNTCWWWKIEKTEDIQTKNKERLVKVSTTSTEVDYTDAAVRKHGYPKNPPKNCTWGDAGEAYIFCSSRLPMYIDFDKEKNKYIGTIPFTDQDGSTAGATEGVGNLYLHICNKGKKPHFEINPKFLGEQIPLEKPTDVFNR